MAALRLNEPKFLIAPFILIALGALVSFYPMLALTLFLAIPPVFLVILKKTRFTGFLILLFLSPFLGIVKGLTGVRYSPLIFDLALLLLVASVLAEAIFARSIKINIVILSIAFFLILGLVQILNPNVPSLLAGLEGFRATAFQATAFFAGLYLIRSKKQIQSIMGVLTVSAFIVGIYGVKQFFWPSAVDLKIVETSLASPISYQVTGKLRAFSTLSGPFHLGIFMVLATLLLVNQSRLKNNFYRITLMTVLIFALILTITRTNWMAMIGGVLFLMIVSVFVKKEDRSIRPILIAVSIFVAAFLIIYALPTHFSDPALQYLSSLKDIESTSRYQGTLESWRNTIIPAMIENPFGYGTGSAGDGVNQKFMKKSFTSHNVFLKIGLELGLLGLVIFTAIVYLVFIQGIAVLRKLNDEFYKKTATWILSFIFAVLIAGISTPIIDAYPANLYFWLLIGVLINLREIEKNETEADDQI